MKKITLVLLMISLSYLPLRAQGFYDNSKKNIQIQRTEFNSFSRSAYNRNSGYFSISAGLAKLEGNKLLTYNNDFGGHVLERSDKNGLIISLALGKKLNNGRFELEFSRIRNTVAQSKYNITGKAVGPTASSKITSMAFLLNYYRDFALTSRIKSYIGFGIGKGRITLATTGSPNLTDNSVLNYQYKLGLNYSISDSTDLFIDYRHLGTKKFTITNLAQTFKFSGLKENIIEGGIQFNF